MTEVIEPEQIAPGATTGSLAEALSDVSRGAQRLLADIDRQPQALRIRAGQVHVELEWAALPTSPAQARPPLPEQHELAVIEPAGAAGLFDLCSPTVGTFYIAPEPGAAPFVTEGDQVRAGQQVGIVEAMKLMIPVEAQRDGQVVAVLAANGSSVEYGDRLLTFASTGTN